MFFLQVVGLSAKAGPKIAFMVQELLVYVSKEVHVLLLFIINL